MTASSTAPPRRTPLIVLLGILTALDAIAIDMYLPAMPTMQQHFATSAAWVQASLAVFLVGLAVGQLVYGPLADRYGRRTPLLAGMASFFAGSVLILLADNIETVLAGRALQALGGAAALVIPRAIVADLFEEQQAARVYSILMLVMGLGPVLAPSLGGVLAEQLGWQSIFVALALFGLLCLGAVYLWVEESLPSERRNDESLLRSMRGYLQLLGNAHYRRYTWIIALFCASLFTYISGVPFVLIDIYGLSPAHFGFVFAANAIGMCLLSLLNVALLRRYSPERLLLTAGILHMGFLLPLAAAELMALSNALSAILMLSGAICSLGLVWGNAMSLVMKGQREQAGRASALAGVAQYALASLAGAALGMLDGHGAASMYALMAVIAVITLVSLCRAVHHPRAESKEVSFSS
ncbi:multidrug effflux MFS transporter [Pseudomonas asiatica]|uniref:multidrug effflux MFS transporter n=1 Tax=Pseudomonas asiatica TaxID=2219225 RepID=UPI002570CD45|nr:multidrug effflux MFS transporter [Pseudomonas asiatica]WJD72264.1 multidrug effflux MFS transporter [Pseudomonas asiatica]